MKACTILLLMLTMACVHCTRGNPFAGSRNAGLHVSWQSVADGDTLSMFTTRSIELIVTVKERVDSFSVSCENNILLPGADTIVTEEQFIEEPFSFSFSFHDTGWQDVVLSVFRQGGDLVRDTLSVYVVSLLDQDSVDAFWGAFETLKTTAVGDKNVTYHWAFGAVEYESQVCSTRVLLEPSLFTGTGRLWVSSGTCTSPIDSFYFALSDTGKPTITCVNSPDNDTIYTADTLFNLMVRIDDDAGGTLDSTSVNGLPFDGNSGHVFFKLFERMHEHTVASPLALGVYALDRFQYGNVATDTFVVIFSPDSATSSPVRIRVNAPGQDTTIMGTAQYQVQGGVDNVSTLPLSLLLFLNGIQDSVLLSLDRGHTDWEWSLDLKLGENVVEVFARDTSTSTTLDSAQLVLVLDPFLVDTLPPVVMRIMTYVWNENDVQISTDLDGHITDKPSVKVWARLYDDGVGIDTVTINETHIPNRPGTSWYVTTVPIEHIPSGNEIVVVATDRTGNRTQETAVVFRNLPPVMETVPQPRTIVAEDPYADSVSAFDPDGDTVTFGKESGPDRLTVFPDGYISWTPSMADTGTQPVTIRVWDGYEPVFVTYNLYVMPAGHTPPEPVRFLTTVDDFPGFLEASRDTLGIVLEVEDGTGVPPFELSVVFSANDSVLLEPGTDSLVTWAPEEEDLGYTRLTVVVKDNFASSDTLLPVIIVVEPNSPCTLVAEYAGRTFPDGTLDMNAKQGRDTVVFRISDPDDLLFERYDIVIYQTRTRTITTIDFTNVDTFAVAIDPTVFDGYDTVVAMITDRGGNGDTVSLPIYYGMPPNVPLLLSPASNASIDTDTLELSWQADDPDNDSLWYDIYLGDTPATLTRVETTPDTSQTLYGLSPAGTYYWQVLVHDWKSSVASLVRRFTTQ